jgi:hypothetical protein
MTKTVTIADLVAQGLVAVGQQLRLRGRSGATAVVVASGIEYAGVTYTSPSAAAGAAKRGVSTNGWRAWQLELSGKWVDLAELRSRVQS